MKEQSIREDALLGLQNVGRDVMFALRLLRRSPGFALTAVVTLALIGATAAWIPARRALRVDPSRLMREE